MIGHLMGLIDQYVSMREVDVSYTSSPQLYPLNPISQSPPDIFLILQSTPIRVQYRNSTISHSLYRKNDFYDLLYSFSGTLKVCHTASASRCGPVSGMMVSLKSFLFPASNLSSINTAITSGTRLIAQLSASWSPSYS
jgi:hypothetical protein